MSESLKRAVRKRLTKHRDSQTALQSAMREVHTNEPSTVARANVSEARKEKMRQAIAYAKVRRAA